MSATGHKRTLAKILRMSVARVIPDDSGKPLPKHLIVTPAAKILGSRGPCLPMHRKLTHGSRIKCGMTIYGRRPKVSGPPQSHRFDLELGMRKLVRWFGCLSPNLDDERERDAER